MLQCLSPRTRRIDMLFCFLRKVRIVKTTQINASFSLRCTTFCHSFAWSNILYNPFTGHETVWWSRQITVDKSRHEQFRGQYKARCWPILYPWTDLSLIFEWMCFIKSDQTKIFNLYKIRFNSPFVGMLRYDRFLY